MNPRQIVKVVALAVFAFMCILASSYIEVPFTNKVAMMQMESSDVGFVANETWQSILSYRWYAFVALAVILYAREISIALGKWRDR